MKLGWARATAEGSLDYRINYQFHYGKTHGPIAGLGIKHKISPHVFVSMESYRVIFSEKQDIALGFLTKDRPSMTYAGIGVGYCF